jgi:hypothetical protein
MSIVVAPGDENRLRKDPNIPRYVGGAYNDLVPDLQHPNNPVPLLYNTMPPAAGAGGGTD